MKKQIRCVVRQVCARGPPRVCLVAFSLSNYNDTYFICLALDIINLNVYYGQTVEKSHKEEK